MKKLLLVILCAIITISGCVKAPQTPTAPSEPIFVADPEKLVTVHEDAEFLEAFWEDYIDDTLFTIANGVVNFDNAAQLNYSDMADFAYLKMQRAGESDAIIQQEGEILLKREALERYCKQYFNIVPDFKKLALDEMRTDIAYDAALDAVLLLNHYTLENMPEVGYNDFDQFPNKQLVSVSEYSDGLFVALLEDLPAMALDTENERLFVSVLLKQREDKSLYFVAAHTAFTETHNVSVSGENFRLLPFAEGYRYGTLTVDDDALITTHARNGKRFLSRYSLETAQLQSTLSLDLGAGADSSVFFKVTDDKIFLQHKNTLYQMNHTLQDDPKKQEVALPADAWISDISQDGTKFLLSSEQALLLFDSKTGKTTAIPETATVYDTPDSPMSVRGFGNAQFVLDETAVVFAEGGYEGIHRFWLFDIASGEKTKIDFGGSYETTFHISSQQILLTNAFDNANNTSMAQVIFNFADKSTQVSNSSNAAAFWAQSPDKNGLVVAVRSAPAQNGLETSEVFLLKEGTPTTEQPLCTITAPSGSVAPLGVSPTGKGYVAATYMGEQHLIEVS